MFRKLWPGLAALCGACGATPAPAEDPSPPALAVPTPSSGQPQSSMAPRPMAIHVEFVGGQMATALKVRLTVPNERIGDAAKLVELPFMAEPFRNRSSYADFVTMANGGAYTGRFDAPKGDLQLRYTVALEHAQAGPKHGIDEVPFHSHVGLFLVGRAFVPALKVDGELRDVPLKLTFGSETVTDALGPIPASGRIQAHRELRDAFYLVGPAHSYDVPVAGTTFRLASGDADAESLARIAPMVNSVAGAASGFFGRLTKRPRTLAFHYHNSIEAGGVVGVHTSVVGLPLPTEPTSGTGGILVHELLHQWSRADVAWLSEGFTRYFEIKAQVALRAAGGDVLEMNALSILFQEHDRLELETVRGPVRTVGGNVAYSGGALVAFCLDTELRAAGSSLETVYRSARQRHPEPGTTEAAFRAALSEMPGALKKLDSLLDAPPPFPLLDCVKRTGAPAPTVTKYRGYDLRTLAVDVLGITGFSLSSSKIASAKAGSTFQAGDVITEIGGDYVHHIHEAQWALRNTKPGETVKVSIRRGGAPMQLKFKLPKVDAKHRPWRTRLRAQQRLREGNASPLLAWASGTKR